MEISSSGMLRIATIEGKAAEAIQNRLLGTERMFEFRKEKGGEISLWIEE